jgi:hypothetical protein
MITATQPTTPDASPDQSTPDLAQQPREDPANDNSQDLVSQVAHTTAPTSPNDDSEITAASKYPAWLLEITHQLRNFRQWRLVIRPDHTIDIDYLALLVLQAQKKVRPRAATPQLDLFAIDIAPLATINPETDSEIITMPSASATQPRRYSQATAPEPGHSFTIIDGQNRPIRPNSIILPDDVLEIGPDEQLHDYLGRVAAAAMEAAIAACGSPDAAFIRLGSKAPAIQERTPNLTAPLTASRPTLVLAPARAR